MLKVTGPLLRAFLEKLPFRLTKAQTRAMNEVLRDWYEGDCQAGVGRWNKILERHGMSWRFKLPNPNYYLP